MNFKACHIFCIYSYLLLVNMSYEINRESVNEDEEEDDDDDDDDEEE